MNIGDVMTRNPKVVHPDATVKAAADMMRDLGVGVLPVCDGEKIKGMLTDRDIVVRLVATGKDLKTANVRDAMTRDVHYCFVDEDVREAAQLMKEKQVRRVIVLDRDKRLVGILSLGDLATQAHAGDRMTADVSRRVSEPTPQPTVH